MNENLNENTLDVVCSFCGANSNERKDLQFIDSDIGLCSICSNCVEKIYMTLEKNAEDENKYKEVSLNLKQKIKPSKIKTFLDSYVIGQDKAKTILSVSLYNHYKMLNMKEENETEDEIIKELTSNNVMLVGSSGSGKTLMVRKLAELMKVPFTITDITAYSATGYVGRNVEQILSDLLAAANGNKELAEKGIVFIDEIDKIGRKGESAAASNDPGREAVQQGLLKLIEGCTVNIKNKNSEFSLLSKDTIQIDTSNMLFIFGGAFEGIDKIIAKRMKSKKAGLGFGADLDNDNKKTYNEYILNVTTDDLKSFGMIPELLGRIPVVCPLQELNEDDLIKILVEPKDSVIKQYKALLNKDNVDLEFTNTALRNVAKKAIQKKTGARSLRAILQEILNPIMFKIPDMTNIKKVIIDWDEKNNDFKEIMNFKRLESEAEING